MGSSSSKSSSVQEAQTYLTQQFSSACNVTCQNTISDIDMTFINSEAQDINFTQTCSADGTCLSGNAMDATADVLFKATNSANAKNASNAFTGAWINVNNGENDSRTTIRESINQSANETCDVSSYNQMNNISILALNSKIEGSIGFSQDGQAVGRCQLNNNMTAAAYATGLAQNKSQSGKDKKGQKFGDKSGKSQILIYGIIGIVVVVIVVIISKVISGSGAKKEKKAQEDAAFEAMAAAGCGDDRDVLRDAEGNAVRNPDTGKPMCTPKKAGPAEPKPSPVYVVGAGGGPAMIEAEGEGEGEGEGDEGVIYSDTYANAPRVEE